MKKVFFLLSFVFAIGFSQAQQPINVYEKKEGTKNLIMARNTGKLPYLVKVDIHATGMDVTPGLVVETVVPAGHIVQMAEITPRPGESWTYGYEVSYMEHTAENNVKPVEGGSPGPTVDDEISPVRVNPPAVQLSDARIIMYSKPGCGRCAAMKKQLDDRKIPYELVDVSTTSPEVNNMWKKLRDGGFTGDSVTMPVVRVDGKYHYNIKDLTKFVAEL
jgi:glutaredoxin